MEMRVYDVRDILINLDDKEPLKFDITAAATSQMGLSKGAETVKTKDASERVLDLIELIVTTVEPSSWSNRTSVIGASATGGQRSINIPGQGEGSIIARTGQPGDLVVVNNKYVHKQIEDMLASLRSSQNLQVSIEARFIEVTDKFLEEIGSNISKFFSKNTSVNTGAGTGEILGETLSGKGLELNYSILNNSMLKGFLSAVQESKDSEILTSPRITLSNTQRGNIAVVKTINYVQSTSVSEGIVTPVIGTIPEGTTFDVRPIVSADRKYIYLEVTPSVFPVEEITSFTFSGLSTDATVGGGGAGTSINVPPEQTVQLPEINVSQVSVTVCVPDKGTLMIGGLGSINKSNLTNGIPILSKIPVLKRLFSLDQKNNKKSNLVILLKPTIIIREEQEANFLSLSNNNFNVTDSNNNKK
jgi:type II secretory pathway component GspD/PulD (secretin)